MAPLYSTSFLNLHNLSGVSAPITVPAGHRYIVRQLTAYASPGFASVYAYFRNLTHGNVLYSVGWAPGQVEWFGFYGALVFQAGESFRWETQSVGPETADLYAGGYDLLAP
jgi:hypothetical protein